MTEYDAIVLTSTPDKGAKDGEPQFATLSRHSVANAKVFDNGVPEILESEIELGDEPVILGEGCFGLVVRGKVRGVNVAIKLPKFDEVTDEQLEEFREEVRVMSKLYHPNIALFMGACIDEDGEIKIVTELLDTDIGSLMLKEGNNLTLFHRMQFAKQIAEGIAWIHGAGMIHRDLKPSNVLYNRKADVCKIIDFGFTLLTSEVGVGEVRGTPFWIAPETLRGEGATAKSDVYSYAIILSQLVSGKQHPFSDKAFETVTEFFGTVLEGLRPSLPKGRACPTTLRTLIQLCWDDDPKVRPSFEGIIQCLNDDILVDCAMFDPKARALWKKKFMLRNEVAASIAWDEFEFEFSAKFSSSKAPLSPGSPEHNCIKMLFTGTRGDSVSIEDFGRIIGYFGPLRGGWVERVTELLREEWFCGDIDRKEACQKLANQPPKTFLVRFASSGADYTISYVSRGKGRTEVFHTRINHGYCSTKYSLPQSKSDKTLEALIASLMKSPKSVISLACPNGTYLSCFQTAGDDSGYGAMGGYSNSGTFYVDESDEDEDEVDTQSPAHHPSPYAVDD